MSLSVLSVVGRQTRRRWKKKGWTRWTRSWCRSSPVEWIRRQGWSWNDDESNCDKNESSFSGSQHSPDHAPCRRSTMTSTSSVYLSTINCHKFNRLFPRGASSVLDPELRPRLRGWYDEDVREDVSNLWKSSREDVEEEMCEGHSRTLKYLIERVWLPVNIL